MIRQHCILIAMACGSVTPLTVAGSQSREPGGSAQGGSAVRLRNTVPVGWRDTAHWNLVLERKLGDAGGGSGSLARPSALGVDRTGRVVVLDLAGDGIVVFGADGRFANTIGRKGSGPGEYRGPAALGVRGDTVMLCDAGEDRVTLWRVTGERIAGWRSPGCAALGPITFNGPDRAIMPTLIREGRTARSAWLRRRIDGRGSIDTLLPPPDPVVTNVQPLPRGTGSSPRTITIQMPIPFGARAFGTFTTNDTYVFGHSSAYTLHVTKSMKDTVRIIEMPGVRVPVDRAVADSFVALLRRRNPDFDRNDFPRLHAYFIGIHGDETGRIWVARPAGNGGVGFFDVIDTDGRFLGTVRAPGGQFHNALWANGRIYRPAEDANGEPVIEVYRIDRR